MQYKFPLSLGISSNLWKHNSFFRPNNKDNLEQMLSEAALAGFEGIEVNDIQCLDVGRLKKMLSLRKLVITGQLIGIFTADNTYKKIIPDYHIMLENMVDLGIEYLIVIEMVHSIFSTREAIFDRKYCLKKDDWQYLSYNLNKLGKLASSYGIKMCFQPHICTVVRTFEEIEQLMETTDEQYVKLCLDTSSFLFLQNIDEVFEKFGRRIAYVRLQDVLLKELKKYYESKLNFFEAVATGYFTIPGDGEIDFVKIFHMLNRINYSGWIIVDAEQKLNCISSMECALKAYHYMQALLEFKFINTRIK